MIWIRGQLAGLIKWMIAMIQDGLVPGMDFLEKINSMLNKKYIIKRQMIEISLLEPLILLIQQI